MQLVEELTNDSMRVTIILDEQVDFLFKLFSKDIREIKSDPASFFERD